MPLTVTQKQRGPSAVLCYSLIGELPEAPKPTPPNTFTFDSTATSRHTSQTNSLSSFKFSALAEQVSGESVINNLVAVKAKVKDYDKKKYIIYLSYMKLDEEENEKIILRVSCGDLLYSKKWICSDAWSGWQKIGIIDVGGCMIDTKTYVYNLQVDVTVRKIEKSELCAKMYLDADFTDFSLSGENGSVAVHKIVMASHSDVFKAMLNGEWKETIEGKIEVKGTTRECLEHLKDYMYLDIIPDEGLCPLLLLGLRYMIGNLKTRCIGKLTDTITSENLYELLDFACLNNIPELTYEILHSTPSEIVDKAYKSNKANKTLSIPESASSSSNDKQKVICDV